MRDNPERDEPGEETNQVWRRSGREIWTVCLPGVVTSPGAPPPKNRDKVFFLAPRPPHPQCTRTGTHRRISHQYCKHRPAILENDSIKVVRPTSKVRVRQHRNNLEHLRRRLPTESGNPNVSCAGTPVEARSRVPSLFGIQIFHLFQILLRAPLPPSRTPFRPAS